MNKIVQLVPVEGVWAVFKGSGEDPNGFERGPVLFAALYADGTLAFMEADTQGEFGAPNECDNFVRYEFDREFSPTAPS
jgi:hypothetical protein